MKSLSRSKILLFFVLLFLGNYFFYRFFINPPQKVIQNPVQKNKNDSLDKKNKEQENIRTKKVEKMIIDNLFDKNVPNNYAFTLTVTGDYIPARSVNYKSMVYKDFTWSVKDFIPLLKSSDITLINLEAPLLKNCPVTNEGFTFCGDSRHSQGLAFSGVDVACMANNHSSNYGKRGILETNEILSPLGIKLCGTLNFPIAYFFVKGKKVAFVAFNDVGNFSEVIPAKEEYLTKYITQAKKIFRCSYS